MQEFYHKFSREWTNAMHKLNIILKKTILAKIPFNHLYLIINEFCPEKVNQKELNVRKKAYYTCGQLKTCILCGKRGWRKNVPIATSNTVGLHSPETGQLLSFGWMKKRKSWLCHYIVNFMSACLLFIWVDPKALRSLKHLKLMTHKWLRRIYFSLTGTQKYVQNNTLNVSKLGKQRKKCSSRWKKQKMMFFLLNGTLTSR